MSVEFLPRPTPEERVIRFAVAGVLTGLKDTRRAGKRCRKRLTRAVQNLEAGAADPQGWTEDPEIARAAAAWLRRACQNCKRCPGLAVMPKPRR